MAKRKQRKTATQLIADIGPNSAGYAWYDVLDPKDQQYVYDVVKEVVRTPGVALLPVARSLVAELKLARNPKTVARTLRELIEHVT